MDGKIKCICNCATIIPENQDFKQDFDSIAISCCIGSIMDDKRSIRFLRLIVNMFDISVTKDIFDLGFSIVSEYSDEKIEQIFKDLIRSYNKDFIKEEYEMYQDSQMFNKKKTYICKSIFKSLLLIALLALLAPLSL